MAPKIYFFLGSLKLLWWPEIIFHISEYKIISSLNLRVHLSIETALRAWKTYEYENNYIINDHAESSVWPPQQAIF